MKLLDRVWNVLGLVEVDDMDEAQSTPTDKQAVRSDRKVERVNKTVVESKPRRNSAQEIASPVSVSSPSAKSNMIPTATKELGNDKGQLSITQPTGFDDARHIAENVTSGKTVVVNFDRSDGDTTKRTVDFMSGITYAVGGTVQRISGTVFLFAPSNVEVSSSEPFSDVEQGALPWRRT